MLSASRVGGVFFFCFLFFCLFVFLGPHPQYGGSQARGRIGAVAAGLSHNHSIGLSLELYILEIVQCLKQYQVHNKLHFRYLLNTYTCKYIV